MKITTLPPAKRVYGGEADAADKAEAANKKEKANGWDEKPENWGGAEELKRLGAEIVDLGKNALDKIPLDADLRAAIELAQRIKMEGRRRQLQLIGKMLRQRDVEPIRQALDKLKNRHSSTLCLSVSRVLLEVLLILYFF